MKNPTKKRKPFRSREQWKQLIEQFNSDDLSVERYCKQENITIASFRKWQTQFKRSSQKQEPVFVDVTPKRPIASTQTLDDGWAVELNIGDHMILRIRHSA